MTHSIRSFLRSSEIEIQFILLSTFSFMLYIKSVVDIAVLLPCLKAYCPLVLKLLSVFSQALIDKYFGDVRADNYKLS